MRQVKFILAWFLLSSLIGEAKLYEVVVDNLNLRAGPNQNFEVLKKLQKGEKLEVVYQRYGWCKVKLPPDVILFIYKRYVDKLDGKGVVNANRVNVRARPSLKANVVGQLNEGDEVEIIEGSGNWYGIQAPLNCYGWVKAEYLKPWEVAEKEKEVEEKEVEKDLEEAVTQEVERVVEEEGISPEGEETAFVGEEIFRGKLKEVGRIFGRKSRYKLVTPEGCIYYIIGKDEELIPYLDQEVIIKGEKIEEDLIKVLSISF